MFKTPPTPTHLTINIPHTDHRLSNAKITPYTPAPTYSIAYIYTGTYRETDNIPQTYPYTSHIINYLYFSKQYILQFTTFRPLQQHIVIINHLSVPICKTLLYKCTQ